MEFLVRLQPAMTVRWSHWLLGHAAAWQRDDMRLRELLPRVATLPLGSGKCSQNVKHSERLMCGLENDYLVQCPQVAANAPTVDHLLLIHCSLVLQELWQAIPLAWTGNGWRRSWAASAACAPTPWTL